MTYLMLFTLLSFATDTKDPVKSDGEPSSLHQKVGQCIMIGFEGKKPDEPQVQQLAKLHQENRLGGIVIYKRNLFTKEENPNPKQALLDLIHAITKDSSKPLLVALDQEGGYVRRLRPNHGFEIDMISAKQVAQTMSPEQAKTYYQAVATELKTWGINFTLGPVVDLDFGEKSKAIGKWNRSFSNDPHVVAQYAKSFIQAHRENGILTVLKHAPGHGSAIADSHHGLADVTETFQENEMLPYKILNQEGLMDAVMSSHIWNSNVDPQYPATLSSKWVTYFQKFTETNPLWISDCLNMKAISEYYGFEEAIKRSFIAGMDLLLISNSFGEGQIREPQEVIDEVVQIVKKAFDQQETEEKLDELMLDQKVQRIEKFKQNLMP